MKTYKHWYKVCYRNVCTSCPSKIECSKTFPDWLRPERTAASIVNKYIKINGYKFKKKDYKTNLPKYNYVCAKYKQKITMSCINANVKNHLTYLPLEDLCKKFYVEYGKGKFYITKSDGHSIIKIDEHFPKGSNKPSGISFTSDLKKNQNLVIYAYYGENDNQKIAMNYANK